MFIISHSKIFIGVSIALILTSLVSIGVFGLNFGIDFKGGSIVEIEYTEERPGVYELRKQIEGVGVESIRLQPTGDYGFIVRTEHLSETGRQALVASLSFDETKEFTKGRFDSVGPTLGAELSNKAFIALGAVVIAIVLFIAYVFRRVSEPVSSWKYGVIAIIALLHDIIIVTGIFALLGYEISSLFIIALLAIIGLSVNDTIVVFDRIRENLKRKISKSFSETVGKSLNQVFTRSINTSITTLFVLLALFFIGPDTTKHLALALALGIFFGTYSSIFLASPLLVEAERIGKKTKTTENKDESAVKVKPF